MAISVNPGPANIWIDGTPVSKAQVRAILDDIISDANGTFDQTDANIGKIFPTRQTAVDAGQAAIPGSYNRIITIEDGVWKLRGSGATTDRLFEGFPAWGVLEEVASVKVFGSEAGAARLANVQGTDNITADWPAHVNLDGVSNTALVIFRPAGVNVNPAPTLQINGGNVRTLYGVSGSDPLPAGELDPNKFYTFLATGAGGMVMLGRPMSITEYNSILAGIASAQAVAGEVASYIPVLDQMTDSVVLGRGQSADMSGLINTGASGSPTMIVANSNVIGGGRINNFKIFNTQATEARFAVHSWTDNGDGTFTRFAYEEVFAAPGYNEIPVSVPVPDNGLIGFFGDDITGVASSLSTVPVYAYGAGEVTEMDDSNLVSNIRLMVGFDIETRVLSQTISNDPPITNGKGLTSYRASVAKLNAVVSNTAVRVVLCGDSWTERLICIAQPLAQVLQDRHGIGGTGWMSVDADREAQLQLLGDAVMTSSGTWTLNDVQSDPTAIGSLDGYSRDTSDPAAIMTITGFYGNRFDWYYQDGAGSFEYSVDGGPPVTVAGGNTGAVSRVQVAGLTHGAHTLAITHTTTTATVRHYGGYASGPDGVVFSKAGNGGTTGGDWSDIASGVGTIAADIGPDLVIMLLGTNDAVNDLSADQFEQGFRDVIAAYKAAKADVGFIAVLAASVAAGEGKGLYEQYRQRLYNIHYDTPGVEVVSLFDLWPDRSTGSSQGLWNDAWHPNLTGGWVNAGLLDKLLR